MKRTVFVLLLLLFCSCAVFANELIDVPVPGFGDDESEQSAEYNVRYTAVTELRFNAFENAQVRVVPDISEDRLHVVLFNVSPDGMGLHKVKIPNAKMSEYTDGNFSLKFKDTPDRVYFYDKNFDLFAFADMTNKGKIPFSTYYYTAEGNLYQIEIKPERYRSYFYGLNGLLVKYRIDNNFFGPDGKELYKKKGL